MSTASVDNKSKKPHKKTFLFYAVKFALSVAIPISIGGSSDGSAPPNHWTADGRAVVRVCWMLSRLNNWGPRFDVLTAGMPNLLTHHL